MDNEIMVVGGINADITGFSSESMIMNDSNPGNIEISAGGVGRNIGENLIHMGYSVGIVSAFAKDAMGIFLMDHCKDIGMDFSGSIVMENNARTSIYLSTVDADGEMISAVSDMKIIDRLSVSCLDACKKEFDKASYIVIDANLPVEIIKLIMRKYKDKHIALDPVSAKKTKKLKDFKWSVEIVKPNMHEAEILTGIRMDSRDKVLKGLRMINDNGAAWVLLSDGENGAWLSGKGRVHYCPSFHGGKQNVNGAGDAFMAGAIYGHSKDRGEADMLYYGHAAASIAMESGKTVNPDINAQVLEKRMEELKRCLKIEIL
jgi:pseudouridine kinase